MLASTTLTRMRVLVTGGAGFIGSQFVRRLAEGGDAVVVLDKLTYAGNRANLEGAAHEFHQGDIADPDAVARAAKGCDAIVNFAAETHVDRSILGPAEFILTDILGTQVLLDYARSHQIRHLQVSTDEVYGDIPLDAEPCDESAPVRA
jgi:dTDP-glucose 4,6-dehydratase